MVSRSMLKESLGWSGCCGSWVLFALAGGCTATVTTSPGGGTPSSCSIDSAVGCGANASGYSCVGGATPEQSSGSLACSGGTPGAVGEQLYCCVDVAFAPNTCGPDASVTGCVAPSIGFSCTSDNRPEQSDTSLVCSSAAPGPAGSTLYCCNTPRTGAAACAADATVSCTTAGATGYTCPSGVTPPPALNCGGGAPEPGGAVGYCCGTATTSATCAADATVSCATAGATGYSCPSGVAPPTPLSCGSGVPESGGAVGYCCATTGAAPSSTCGQNGAIACAAGFAGYSCMGADKPWEAMPALICEPAAAIGSGGYCCVTSANTCAQAPGILDCPAGWYGVACSGSDAAMAANSSLLCASDPNGGAMEFCCTNR